MIIAQLSDSHIGSEGSTLALERAVEHLLRLPARPDMVIVTGDCTDNGGQAEYDRFRALLRPLTMPVYAIPGNHDDRAQLLAAFGPQAAAPLDGFVQYVVEGWPVRLIALDTNIPGQGGGALGPARLGWLEQRLAEAPDRPTVIFMHHPPFPTGLAPLDQIGLAAEDAAGLGAIVGHHPQVERIVAGHVHTTMLRRFHGTLAMTAPSTKQHLLPDFNQPDRLAVLIEAPGCLLHVWRPATGLLSYTSLLGEEGPVSVLHDGTRWL
jgi:3',5'-cyclic AMP phosphodiesterase CpdA